ncbi:Ig-like domain repeat protein [Nocardia veterana]|uniref:Ig-like domain-containing protein n=1 Tax=Nocardia veterana TaxID=132249 RepID=A0A7X6LVV8_9NOCA|nr:Ig-like domain repeat protein [Nocardia veterana]NKY84867.1 hypothetical protein [Nocardia veterana]
MSGFRVSRDFAGYALAAAALVGAALPVAVAPTATAAVAPTIAVSMAGSALSPVNGGLVGCGQTAVATVRNPDGSPVTHGTVDFFSNLSGISGNVVGSAPVVNGVATIGWMPDRAGQHVVSAVYYDGLPELSPAAGYTTVNAAGLGGVCV